MNKDKSNPPVLGKSIVLTCAVDAWERRNVMSMDIPNAYIQTTITIKLKSNHIIMKICGKLVDWFVELDQTSYLEYVVIEKVKKVLYLKVLKAIYGMLEAGLLWYKKF